MRPRKKDRHLPSCMFHRHGAYYLVKRGEWKRLGTELNRALVEYNRLFNAPTDGAMSRLIDAALKPMKAKLAESTWDQYEFTAQILKKTFEEFSPEQVKPKHVVQMRRDMSDRPGMANRCISLLRQVFEYALEEELVEANPVLGVKTLRIEKRTRLISEGEFKAIYEQASPRLQVTMDLLYLTGQRVTDVLQIRRADIASDGIYFKQKKTGARLVVSWTPELREVVERAKTLNRNIRSMTLLHSARGGAPSYNVTQAQWREACSAAKVIDADMRDLRAMSGTAAKRQGKDPTALLGHTNPEMTKRYLRDRVVPVVHGPSFGQVEK